MQTKCKCEKNSIMIENMRLKIVNQKKVIARHLETIKTKSICLDRISSERDYIKARIKKKYGEQAWIDIHMSVDNPCNFNKERYEEYAIKRAIEAEEIRKIREELKLLNEN